MIQTENDFEANASFARERADILVICLSNSWGGLEQVAASDALEVGALGVKVRVLCLQGSPIHENLTGRKEVTTIPLDYRPRNYFDLKMRAELSRLISEGVNLIHTHQTSILGSIVPWLWPHPHVALLASRHIMNDHNKKDPFHRLIYSRVDALIAMSQTLRKNILDTHAIRDSQVTTIYLGLDFNVFDPKKIDPVRFRSLWGADPQTVVIGLVGRIDPAKGQATFIRAAAGLLKTARPGEKLKFVMVGEETLGSVQKHLDELKRMVTQFRLEDSVVFAGYQEDIPGVMRAFDIFVMPSRREAFGLVAIEAMAMECPILISAGGSAREIVGEQEFGHTVRPDDAFDLQRQLRELLDHPERRAEMGKKAREHVKKNYDRTIRLQKTIELYDRTLRRRFI